VVVVSEQVMVAPRREVACALHLAADEVAGRRLVERTPTAGEHAGIGDDVLDHRLGVGPVDGGARDEASERIRWRWQLAARRDGG
jgi:hypothetical protein